VRLKRDGEWHPSPAAEVLWLLVAATLLGWIAMIVFGHPVVLAP
jgi:hypothetical protein